MFNSSSGHLGTSLPAVSYTPNHARVHSLDGMRAVSVTLVVVAHYGLDHIVPGGLGVTTFFFISGFIITRLLLAEFDKTGGINLQAFYSRRFWRLWPAIATAVFGVVLAGLVVGEWWAPLGEIVSSLLFLQNYWGVIYPTASPLGIHWSLAVEFHFYLIWPLVVLLAMARRDLAVPVALAGLLVFFLHRLWLVFAFDHAGTPWEVVQIWTYQLSHLRGDSLLYGCLLALVAFDKRWRTMLTTVAHQRSIWIGVAILLATLAYRDEFFRVTFRYSVQGIALFLIFAGVLYAEQGGIVRRFLNLPFLTWIGSISFSIYLWHKTMWRVTDEIAGVDGRLTIALVATGLTLLVSWASYRFIELHFIRYGQSLRHQQADGSLSIGNLDRKDA